MKMREETVTQWGVRFSAGPAGDHVDAKDDEAAARSWLRALRFCGNADARLMARADPDGAWITVDGGS